MKWLTRERIRGWKIGTDGSRGGGIDGRFAADERRRVWAGRVPGRVVIPIEQALCGVVISFCLDVLDGGALPCEEGLEVFL